MRWLTNRLAGGLLDGLNAILARFARNKDAVEANVHAEQMTAMQAMAAEYAPRANRTWWDSLVDGLNRLPRPLLAFMVIGVLVWAPLDPAGFATVMAAYGLIPDWLVIVMGQVILLFCGGRMLERWPSRLTGPGPEAVQAVRALMREIRVQEAADEAAAEASDPVDNPSVRAWLQQRPMPRAFDARFEGP